MKRKNISLSGEVFLGILPKGIVDFSQHELFIYVGEGQKCLGFLVEEGENKFLDIVQNENFIPFQNGLSFALNNDNQRVVLFRVGNQLKIEKVERKYK